MYCIVTECYTCTVDDKEKVASDETARCEEDR